MMNTQYISHSQSQPISKSSLCNIFEVHVLHIHIFVDSYPHHGMNIYYCVVFEWTLMYIKCKLEIQLFNFANI